MVNGFKQKVDGLMDLLYGSGVTNHATIIEQINYLVFLRALSGLDDEKAEFDAKYKPIFRGKYAKYHWKSLKDLNPEALYETLERAYQELPKLAHEPTVALLYQNAHVKVYDKPTLRRLVHQIEETMGHVEAESSEGHRDMAGDMYEYLLSKLSTAGTNGQFRTPRHIIKFMVDVIDPGKNERILDPACGTAGFLVAAYRHLQERYTSEKYRKDGRYPMDKLAPDEREFVNHHAFTGFDSDSDMIKFGLMNLYLHHLGHSKLVRQNTLTDTAGDRSKFDVILANPPFAGKIDRSSISEDLQMGTGVTEVLFLRYMIDHLSDKGRCAVIVPEGVIFQSSGAHKEIRRRLIDEAGLFFVASLPAGVFNPYSGVKTSILFLDKSLPKTRNTILFARIENDGYDLGAQRRPVEGEELTVTSAAVGKYIEALKSRKPTGLNQYESEAIHAVQIDKIRESDDYNLSGGRYREPETDIHKKWPMVTLGDSALFAVESGGTPDSKNSEYWNGDVTWVTLADLPQANRITSIQKTKRTITNKGLKNSSAKLLPVGTVLVSSRATIGRVGIAKVPLATNQGFKNVVIKNSEKVASRYLAETLATKTEEFMRFATGGTFKEISKTNFSKIKIPLPSLQVQKEIVSEIESKQQAIENAQGVIENLQRERQHFGQSLSRLGTFKKVPLAELAKVFVDGDWVETKDQSKDGIRLIQTGNVGLGEYLDKTSRARYISESTFKRLKCKEVKSGDVLISRLPDPVGRACITPKVANKMVTAVDCTIVRFDEKRMLPAFFVRYATSMDYFRSLGPFLTGSSRRRISRSNLGKVQVPVPPIKVQERLVADADKENEVIAINHGLIQRYKEKISDIVHVT